MMDHISFPKVWAFETCTFLSRIAFNSRFPSLNCRAAQRKIHLCFIYSPEGTNLSKSDSAAGPTPGFAHDTHTRFIWANLVHMNASERVAFFSGCAQAFSTKCRPLFRSHWYTSCCFPPLSSYFQSRFDFFASNYVKNEDEETLQE